MIHRKIYQMVEFDKTSMGGEDEAFQTTSWEEIQDAQKSNETHKKEIIDKLLSRYWKPVYCYLRRKGYENESAKDLTQGFFHEIVLERDFIQQPDETKGRFRTFLLKALDRSVVSAHRTDVAEKRHPKDGLISLKDFDEASLPLPSEAMMPDEAFTYYWASVLLDEVLTEVEQACSQEGKEKYWAVFRARVLKPIMEGIEPPSLTVLCQLLGIESETKVSNMIVTVKRRFQSVMRRRLSLHVSSDEEVKQEICDLMKILSKTH